MFRESDGCPKEREAPLLAYSDIVRDHFLNPRNVGALESPDGVGTVGDPVCGDFLKVTIRVEEDRIAEIRFSCRGCPAAIATASAMTELAAGKTLDEAWEITDEAMDCPQSIVFDQAENRLHFQKALMCSLMGGKKGAFPWI